MFAIFAAGPSTVAAQTAQLTGRVMDATSAVLPEAAIHITKIDTGMSREVVSNEEGYYTVPFLAPGLYTVTAHLTDFRPATREALVLSVGQTARLDFVLEIGGLQKRYASKQERHGSSNPPRLAKSSTTR